MPIPHPILDDRSYLQLRDELVRRIPVYAPEWTDHNPSDPGVTLIELFAFLGENLLYRFNQIPETARLEFLRLLQIPLRPAHPSRALVTMKTDKLEFDALGNPTGALISQGSVLAAGKTQFETETELLVWPLSIQAVARGISRAPNRDTEPETHEFATRVLDAIGPLAPGHAPAFYENKIVDLSLPPVDFKSTVDGILWIAVLLKDPTPDKTDFELEKKKYARAVLNLGLVLDPLFESLSDIKPCPGPASLPPTHAVEWRVSKGGPPGNGPAPYTRITVEGDTTRGLSQDGVIRLRLPADPADFGRFTVEDLGDADKRGTGSLPPVLDEATEQRVLCWIQAFRPDQVPFERILFLGLNATEVVQTRKGNTEFLGTGNAQPNQVVELSKEHVIPGSVQLDVEENGGWVPWLETDNLWASRADDRHFVLDAEAGKIRFGDGFHGFPPPIGQRIRVRGYRYGGGIAGNVAAKAINAAVTSRDGKPLPQVKVENPLRARGGTDAESIQEALTRIPGELRRRDRAVTMGDFQELARATPGSEVGRAECLPRFHPPSKQREAAGVVSVVIWPREDAAHPNAPVPDRNLLRAVCAWLDQHRLVTTELYVIPPTYRQVAVAVGLQAKPGYGIEAVRRWVELVLRQYLAPLPPFGPEGQGWPLGRPVIGAELEAAALQVEGVQFLTGLKLVARARTSDTWETDAVQLADGTVITNSASLELYEVPELSRIIVVDGSIADLDPAAPLAPPDAVVPVPVPILRDEC